jgi:transcriptional regulator
MHLPGAFEEHDLTRLDALVAADSFVTLASVRDGEPVADHLPVLYRRDGARIALEGHVARANPLARHAGPALAIVHGPHGYVSPGWYPDKEAAARVPTWNYVVAHLHGRLHWFDDEDALGALVAALTDLHEARSGGSWRYEHARIEQRGQLRGIAGFRLEVERVALKFKLNQNHPRANQLAVAGALARSDQTESRALAALMRERLGTAAATDSPQEPA